MPRPRELKLGPIMDDLEPFAIERMAGRMVSRASFIPLGQISDGALDSIPAPPSKGSMECAVKLIAGLLESRSTHIGTESNR
jgi:hypothetical protein